MTKKLRLKTIGKAIIGLMYGGLFVIIASSVIGIALLLICISDIPIYIPVLTGGFMCLTAIIALVYCEYKGIHMYEWKQ